jgi:hypothetical protein
MKLKRSITNFVAMTATIILLLGLLGPVSAQQQPASPRKSAEMVLNGKKISVDYGAPSMRGRKIFGGLVPYDQVWRFGANKATHFTSDADLMFGAVAVPKGTYTLYIWPTDKGLKLIINKQTGQWGTQYDQGQDLARIDMKVEKTMAPVEMMVISLAPAGKGGVLKMEWENTSASVNFTEKK